MDRLSAGFEMFRQDEMGEAEKGFGADFPEIQEYRAAGFPSLRELAVSDPILFGRMILYLALDVLNELDRHRPEGSVLYSINSLDECRIEGGQVVLEGMAYRVA
jgi:hypothetical protein